MKTIRPAPQLKLVSSPPELLILCKGAEHFRPISAAVGLTTIPKRRYSKELIKVGQYVKDSEGLAFEITPASLKNFARQFREMKRNGVKVAIPVTHGKANDPTYNRGWVDDIYVEGESLWMSCTLIGGDAILAASRSDVSIYAEPTFTDGKGHVYQWPILHVALVTDPVVPGLSAFVPLAASLRFANTGVPTMDLLGLLQRIAEALGIAEPITDANAEQLIAPAINALIEKAKEAPEDGAPAPVAAPATSPAVGAASSASQPAGSIREEKITRTFAASRAAEPPNPMMVKVLADNRRLRIKSLADAGRISAAQAKKLEEQWIGDGNKAVSLALSRNEDGADFDRFIEVLDMNGATVSRDGKSRTGPQLMRLSHEARETDAEKPNAMQREVEARRKAAGVA